MIDIFSMVTIDCTSADNHVVLGILVLMVLIMIWGPM